MKLMLGSVIWRTEETAYSQSMRFLWAMLMKRGIEFSDASVVGDALVSRARSLVASNFLRSDCDVLLCIDSDIWFRPQDALKIVCEAFDGLAPDGQAMRIVGALYMTRKLETQPAIMLPDQKVACHADARPVEAQFLSGGFIAVQRTVFETLAQGLPECQRTWTDAAGRSNAFWPFYMPYCVPWPEDGYMYLSEDWAFCQRAKEAGFKLWLDPSIRLGHMGSYLYTLEDLIRSPKPTPMPLELHRNGTGQLETTVIPIATQEQVSTR